jgi:hypothetical protein
MPGMLPEGEWSTTILGGGGPRRIMVVIGHRAPFSPSVEDPFGEDVSEFEEEFKEDEENRDPDDMS